MNKLDLFTLLFFFISYPSVFIYGQGKTTVDIYASDKTIIDEVLTGEALSATNIRFRGTLEARAVFKITKSRIPFEQGIILSTGDARTIPGVNRKSGFSGIMGSSGDRELQTLAKGRTFDAVSFEFDFEAEYDIIKFHYVFGSEEYPEYVGSGFNDVFGFFLVDLETEEVTNMAVIPNTNSPITINTINDRINADYYVDNRPYKHVEQPANPLELDGFTTTLVAFSSVTPGRKYRIKIGIADVGDDNLDSAVFLEEGSFESMPQEEFYIEYEDYINGFSTKPDLEITKKEESESNIDTITQELDTAQTEKQSTPDSNILLEEEQATAIDSLRVYFETDAFTLNNVQETKLISWLSELDFNAYKFEIRAHTDNIGPESYNNALSEKRASHIGKSLFRIGVHNINITSTFHGESEPVLPNDNAENRALNRRVEIIMTSKNKKPE